MPIIKLPYKFNPRHYQAEAFNQIITNHVNRCILIWPRRHGKDLTSINLLVMKAMQRVGTYYYLFPEYNQVRQAIWEGMDSEGVRFLDRIPKQLIARVNNTKMVVYLVNGSIIRFAGSDYYDSFMGANAVGIIFSEYSIQDPNAWFHFSPMIAENGGWAIFIYTPRGLNHGHDLYINNLEDKEWYVNFLTIDKTFRHDGSPVITPEILARERKNLPEDIIQQEYFCSFDAGRSGAVYGEEIKEALNDERICTFDIDTSLPVYTFWDIGYGDYTAIWFMQTYGQTLCMVNYYENRQQTIQHYLKYLEEFRLKNNIKYARHMAPHDFFNHGIVGSPYEVARKHGYEFECANRNLQGGLKSIVEGIATARILFKRVWFHEEHCKRGIECLRNYHTEYVEKDRVWKKTPVHDWSSHGADAFRYFAVGWDDEFKRADETQQAIGRVTVAMSSEGRHALYGR